MPTADPSAPMRGSPAVLIESNERIPSTPKAAPSSTTEQRQQHAFGQQLARDSAACRADRGADRQLAPTCRGSHQQQVGNVRTSNQQNKEDRRCQHQQRWAAHRLTNASRSRTTLKLASSPSQFGNRRLKA